MLEAVARQLAQSVAGTGVQVGQQFSVEAEQMRLWGLWGGVRSLEAWMPTSRRER